MDGFGAIAIIKNTSATIAKVTKFNGLEAATRSAFRRIRISLLAHMDQVGWVVSLRRLATENLRC
jgi:putative aminopeptidase FrvX